MDLNITDLFTNGLNIATIIIAVLLMIVGNAVNVGITETIKNKSKAKIKGSSSDLDNKKTIKDLRKLHPIFNDIKYYRDVKVPTCHIGGPVRTIVFRDCLKIYYDVCLQVTEEIIEKEITNGNFLVTNRAALIDFLLRVRESLEKNGIPEKVIDKFCDWCRKRNEHLLSVISDIDSSTVVSSIVEKEYIVLSTVREISYFVLLDAEKTLKGLNGELSGTKYKGLIIEPLH